MATDTNSWMTIRMDCIGTWLGIAGPLLEQSRGGRKGPKPPAPGRRPDNAKKLVGLQAGAAHQGAIHIWQRQYPTRVGGFHRTTVKNAQIISIAAEPLGEPATDHTRHLHALS